MKIVIFGIGEIYRKTKRKIAANDEIIAFIDNNKKIQGERIDGIKIYSPAQLFQMAYDKVVIMSDYAVEMKKQLLEMGCSSDRILHYLEYVSRQSRNKLELYFTQRIGDYQKNCLIICNSIDYHGGALTAVYAALELYDRGYAVVIAAPIGNMQFIQEFEEKGISFLIYPNLQFAKWDELFWVRSFQKIIVNTYPMILCAIEISRHKKVVIWLHESEAAYSGMNFWKEIVATNIGHPNIFLYAVSDVAKRNFVNNMAGGRVRLLPYGIPDDFRGVIEFNDKLTFAVVGTIDPMKQQLLYMEAIGLLNKDYQMDNEFLIIGNAGEDTGYVQKVNNKAELFPNVKLIGGVSREKIKILYEHIDILVVSSSQETMSLVATEAMMYGKVCIVCDMAGMAAYINNRENGLLYRTNDVDSLAQQMEFCIESKHCLSLLGKNARRTYMDFFSMNMFGKRLEEVLHDEK